MWSDSTSIWISNLTAESTVTFNSLQLFVLFTNSRRVSTSRCYKEARNWLDVSQLWLCFSWFMWFAITCKAKGSRRSASWKRRNTNRQWTKRVRLQVDTSVNFSRQNYHLSQKSNRFLPERCPAVPTTVSPSVLCILPITQILQSTLFTL